jgi:hypothetical protein
MHVIQKTYLVLRRGRVHALHNRFTNLCARKNTN